MRLEVRWPAILIWLAAWVGLVYLDGPLNLGNLALLLVLVSACAGLWLSALASVVVSAGAVLLFNWLFVAPRHTFHVLLDQDLLLLVTMLGVSAVVSVLMARWRKAAELERQHAQHSDQLRQLGAQFREMPDPKAQAQLLQNVLQQQGCHTVALLLLQDATPQPAQTESHQWIGFASEQDQQGLWACVQQFGAIGPGTGRHENLSTLFLPLRGRTRALGAAAIQDYPSQPWSDTTRAHMQQACDSLGLEIEREQTLHWAQATKAESQSQRLRNTLLTAISHDYRTPLANLMGAASSIRDQCERLSTAQLRNLAQTVLDEAQHLNRMTTNTLHLARLDAAPLSIHKDWESLEEILGSVLSKTRMRYPNQRIQIGLPAQLPLIHCDAILLIQLFDNLIENAIKYSPPGSLLGIQAKLHHAAIQVGVLDEGSGIDDLWKEKVFQAFERVHTQADASQVHQLRRGMGVGLAVCKAIAKVHGATIWAADRAPQGTALWLSLPLQTQPAPDTKEA